MKPTPILQNAPTRRGRDATDSSRETRGAVERVDRILIIRLGALGDVVRTLPAVIGLRSIFPGAHLAWLVEPSAAGVVDVADVVDETIVFPRGELVESMQSADWLSLVRRGVQIVRRLRDRRFDLVLDFHGIFKSGLLSWLSGAPVRYGFGRPVAKEGSHLFANRRVDLDDPDVSRFDRNAALVRALSPDVEFPDRPFLQPSPLAVARLAARLRVSGREKASGFVLIHPGSSLKASHKRYDPTAWAEVARHLAENGMEVWLASGSNREERQIVSQILAESGGAAVSAPETRSFDDLLALLVRASVFVSCDSGPLHAASIAGVPVVQLLGPTDPRHNAPWRGSPAGRIHVALPCSPCRRGCRDAACMRAIPPALVVEEIQRLRGTAERDVGRSSEQPR